MSAQEFKAFSPVAVAFFGDQGVDEPSRRVLHRVKHAGAELTVRAGDLNYGDDPSAWYQQMREAMGQNFRYLLVVGNDDVEAWEGYQAAFRNHLPHTSAVTCQGDLGVQSIST